MWYDTCKIYCIGGNVMKKWISRYTETVSFWIMLVALLCFGVAFFISTWRNPAPPYRLLFLLFLPAVLYGLLTLVESH